MTQPEDHTQLQFTDYARLSRDLGSEPINLGRHVDGRPAILDPFQVVHISGPHTGKTQTAPPARKAR